MTFTDRERFDVICVGDTATDVYVTLSAPKAEIRREDGDPRLVLPFGSKVPYESTVTVAAGGNAANAAVACARLGLRVALATYLGADQLGRDLVTALHDEGVSSSLVRLDPDAPTNRHFVLRLGPERTILVRHESYDYHWPHLRPEEVPAWLYLSSVGRDAHDYEEQIADWLEDHPSVELAFQPGTFQIAAGAVRLARLYRRAALVVCNREEAGVIAGIGRTDDMDALLDGLLALGPRQVVVTDGTDGACAATAAERYEVPLYPDPSPPLDRTGAGDAFAATLLAYLVRGCSLDAALLRAPVNAMSVVQCVGTQAGLLHPGQLATYLGARSSEYRVRTLHPLQPTPE
jgi:sugar/nucleoside kinase (ribokinase family)